MIVSRLDPHPDPPTDLVRRKLPTIDLGQPLVRIHKVASTFLFFGRLRNSRFDAPQSEYGVMYLSTTAAGAFVETLWKSVKYRSISSKALEQRNITVIPLFRKKLNLVDLGSKNLITLGADGRLFAGDFYQVSRKWSKAFFDHPAGLDGIFYPARHDINQRSVALFDRARKALNVNKSATSWLGDPANPLRAEILHTYLLRTI